jgi:hypothetical protein
MEWSPVQIRSAGFDLGAFVSDLEAMGLRFFDIDGGPMRPLTRDGLLALDYRGGILITREPRQ